MLLMEFKVLCDHIHSMKTRMRNHGFVDPQMVCQEMMMIRELGWLYVCS
jgi:hypothetical protein